MADEAKTKPGFMARWFGRGDKGAEKPTEPAASPEVEAAALVEAPAEAAAPAVTPEPVEQQAIVAVPAIPQAGDALAVAVPSAPAAERVPAELAPPSPPPLLAERAPAATPKLSWWKRLKAGLSRTSSTLGSRISDLFTKRKLDADTLEDLEDILIQADLGLDVSARIAAAVGQGRYDRQIAPEEVRGVLATEVAAILDPVALPLAIDPTRKPFVILMVGVNGSGKTTTIGKLAAKFRAEGRSVMLAAGDTFRAAAIEQLKVWGARTGAEVVAREQGADAAGLAYEALQKAKERGVDVLMIDTAGRLQNKTGLMDELAKVVRVIRKLDAETPHAALLVLDATVGQNAISQVEAFRETAGVTGLVMTKLDGTARGGILVALADKFGLPVHFIGVGEGVEDLEPFAARDFARAIAGLEEGA